MDKNDNFIRLVHKEQGTATDTPAPLENPPKEPVEEANRSFQTLHYRTPATNEEFTELSDSQIHRLTHMTMNYVNQLCTERGATVDREYWKRITTKILSSLFKGEPLVCPARAGAGKSTWIIAFLLALCELYLSDDPLAGILGGVILVLQKVETLNEVVDTVQRYFPDAPKELIVALQSWTKSGQEYGYCENKQVTSYTECLKTRCPYAATCTLLKFIQTAGRAYVLCMTQIRFGQFRRNGSIEKYMTREGEAFPRRFLIFDEKFDFAPTMELTQEVINNASTELERLVHTQEDVTDRDINGLQISVSYQIKRLFQKLRNETVIKRDGQIIDSPYGLCTLEGIPEDEQQRFQRFCNYLYTGGRRYLTKDLSTSVDVIQALLQGQCLYSKLGVFAIYCAGDPQLMYGSALTIIFDATAEVDGDYDGLGVNLLKSMSPRHMDKVTLYIYRHPDLNSSQSAMKKAWKLSAFGNLIEEILAEHPGKTFLCTYKSYADYFPAHLSKASLQHVLLMEGKDPPCTPYWGGTNGSNSFNAATNCILIGYPRLNIRNYLQRVYTYWGASGVQRKIANLSDRWQNQGEQPSRCLQNDLPEVGNYESRHLAARLEQEIYRCQLRNRKCPDPINVFLFAPPQKMLDVLLERFPGAAVQYIDELPECVALAKSTARTYNDEPTYYAKFAAFLGRWDGSEVPLKQLLAEAGITKEGWKALRKTAHFRDLVNANGAVCTGRGPNVVLRRRDQDCA